MIWTFAGIKAALIKKLKSFDEWKSENLTEGVYADIIEIVSFIFEKLIYYVDFLFIETTSKAQLTESIIERAKFLGYTPSRKTGASGILTIGSDSTFLTSYLKYTDRDVPFKRWHSFSDENGNTFIYATQQKTFYKNSIQKNKYIASGQSATQISTGIVGIPIIGHSFISGDEIKINETINYNGVHTVLSSSTADRVHITATFVSETFTGTERISSGYLYLPIKQGIVKSFTYIATGIINEKIPIYSANIDQNEIQIDIVDENDNILNPISIVSDLYFVNNTTSYTCEIENFSDFTGIYIKFGDNLTSRQLNSQQRVRIIYAETDGQDGDINSSSIITKSIDPIVDVLNTEVTLYLTNEDLIIGGSNLQTTTQINKISGALYNGGYQLNNRESWTSAIEDISYIYKAKVWTELDIGKGTLSLAGTELQNVHYVTAITNTGEGLTSSQETEISTDILIPRKSPTDIVNWKKLQKVGIRFVIDAFITSTVSKPTAQETISNTLQDNYDILKLDFAEEIYSSNYINIIDDVEEVIRHTTTAYYVDENIPIQEVLLETQVSLPASQQPVVSKQILLYNNSPEIWIRRKVANEWRPPLQIAETIGVNIQGVNTYNVSGNVDYTNSRVTYQCFDLINDIVPSISKTATTSNSNNTITVLNTSNLVIGMYVTGLNLQINSIITSIITNTSIVIDKPTNSTGAGTGTLNFCFDSDIGTTFGIKNPNDGQSEGYILYLVYRMVDGNGNRLNDLRLSNFDETFDYLPEMSTFNLDYEI